MEMNGLQYILKDIGIEYDLIMPNSFSSTDLESYSTYFIAYNGGTFEEDELYDVLSLLKQNKKVSFWGGSRDFRFNSNFRKIFHVTRSYDWSHTGLPHLESFETGRFNAKLPNNASFTKSLQYSLRPSGLDGVIYQRNGDGFGVVACKSTEDWGSSLFALTTFVPSFEQDSDMFSYVRQLVINFFQLQPSDCVKRTRRHAVQVSHSSSMLPSDFKTAFNTAQHALGGKPFNQGDSPRFNLYFGNEELFGNDVYDSIFMMVNGNDLEDSLWVKLNTSVHTTRTKIFFSGGSAASAFSNSFDKYLIRNSYVGSWRASNQPAYTLTSSHGLTRGLPGEHHGEISTRTYVIQISDHDATVLAVNGDNVPYLVEKRVSRSSSIAYIVTPFSDWERGDLFVQHVLIHNFYQYF
ncbi:hypothetical protein P9112_008705 [Eukaryota sp. TZLM1-RC]